MNGDDTAEEEPDPHDHDDHPFEDRRAGRPFQRPGDIDEEVPRVLTYGVPFVAALLVALGVAGVALGGWSVVQPAVGGCGDAVIAVSTPAETEQRLADEQWAASVDRLAYEDLSVAEQRTFDEALRSPRHRGTVEGGAEHRAALRRGAIVTRNGTERYTTLAATNECLAVSPLALPLGAASLLVGFVAFGYLWYRFGKHPPWEVWG